MRRVSIDKTTITFAELKTIIGKLFQVLGDEELNSHVIQYQDEEKDWITMSSDEELSMAITLSCMSTNPVLRISLCKLQVQKPSDGCVEKKFVSW